MRRPDGELILFWTLPVVAIIWISAFFLFPGFLHPMSPNDVRGGGRELSISDETARIRYSMILFNWFGVGLIPIVILLAMQIRRMAHRTPILSYCLIACAGGPPTLFLIANMFWLLAAFRPDRAPELTQLLNDLAWLTFTVLVPYLIAQCLLLALAIFWDQQDQPVFKPWVAHFNLLIAVALAPAAFTALASTGPFAWDGLLSFWVKNIAIAVWIIVMGVVLGQNDPAAASAGQSRSPHERIDNGADDDAGSTDRLPDEQARLELPSPPQARAVVRVVGDGHLLQPLRRAVLLRHPRPAAAEPGLGHPDRSCGGSTTTASGILAGFASCSCIAGICAPMNALLAYSMRRMSVSRVFAYSYLIIYSLAAVPGMLVMAIAMTVAALRPDRDPEFDPVALRFRVPVVQRDHGRVHDRLAGLDGGDPARQEPRVPEVVRLPQPVQCADRSRRRAGVDLPAWRVRVERRDRVVDQHGGVRPLHGRLHRVVAKDDRTRGLRHRATARPAGQGERALGSAEAAR